MPICILVNLESSQLGFESNWVCINFGSNKYRFRIGRVRVVDFYLIKRFGRVSSLNFFWVRISFASSTQHQNINFEHYVDTPVGDICSNLVPPSEVQGSDARVSQRVSRPRCERGTPRYLKDYVVNLLVRCSLLFVRNVRPYYY